MGRFYKTTPSNFVDDNIYKPPWELMQSALKTYDERGDQFFGQTELLQGAIDTVQFLDFDKERERVDALKDRYNAPVDDLVEKMRTDPLNYSRHLPELKKLQREMVQDKTSGEWYQIEKAQKDFAEWDKANKEKDPFLYGQLKKHWYDKVVQDRTLDPNATFQGTEIINKPEILTKYRENLKNIKADSWDEVTKGYKINNKGVSEAEVANIAWNTTLSDPAYAGFSQQMGKTLGLPGYLNDKGGLLDAFHYVDKDGKPITFEEIQGLSDEDVKGVKKVLNPQHGFYPELAAASQIYGFTERTAEADEFAKLDAASSNRRQEAVLKGRIDAGLQAQKARDAQELLELTQEGDMDKLVLEFYQKDQESQKEFQLDLQQDIIDDYQERNQSLLDGAEDPMTWDEYMKTYGEGFGRNLQQQALGQGNGQIPTKGEIEIAGKIEVVKKLSYEDTFGTWKNPSVNYTDDMNKMSQNTLPLTGDLGKKGEPVITAKPGTADYIRQQRLLNANAYAKQKLSRAGEVTLSNGSKYSPDEYINWLYHNQKVHSEDAARQFLAEEKKLTTPDQSMGAGHLDQALFLPSIFHTDQGNDVKALYNLGNQVKKYQDEYHEEFSGQHRQVNLTPMASPKANQIVMQEIKNNARNMTVYDEEGQIQTGIISKLNNEQIFVTPANSLNELGIEVTFDGEKYRIIPTPGNETQITTLRDLTTQGVSQDSQYALEMANRQAQQLLVDFSQVGANPTTGSRFVTKEFAGETVSLELLPDGGINLRGEDASITSNPVQVYKNADQFTKTVNQTIANNLKVKTDIALEKPKDQLNVEEQRLVNAYREERKANEIIVDGISMQKYSPEWHKKVEEAGVKWDEKLQNYMVIDALKGSDHERLRDLGFK